MKAKATSFIIAVCLLLTGACCIAGASEEAGPLPYSDSPLLEYFKEAYPDNEIVLLLKGDCNADGIDDLVIVYKADENHNHQVTVFSHEGGYKLSPPIPAPFQDVALEWKDIDNLPPVELVVSGRRGIHHGLGVFRFVDGEWVDLFGGMDECC